MLDFRQKPRGASRGVFCFEFGRSSSLRNGFAVIAGGASPLRRASKDDRLGACGDPSRRRAKSAAPKDDGGMRGWRGTHLEACPRHCEPTGPRKARPDDRLRIEPGIQGFPDAELRIWGLVLRTIPE